MKTKTGYEKACVVAMCLLITMSLVLSGCQTYGEAAGLGAATGAGAGAVIGHQSGHAGEGAVIGAVLGTIAGLVAHDVKARRSMDEQTTAQRHQYDSQQGEVLELDDAQVYPHFVKPGNMAEATIQYALLGVPSKGVDVVETRILKRNNEVIAELSSKTFRRTAGTWVSTLPFRISDSLEPGEYVIMQVVQTRQSRISASSAFTVGTSVR